jgi:hypothetical protein
MRTAGGVLIAVGVLVLAFAVALLGAHANACDNNCSPPVTVLAVCGIAGTGSILAGLGLLRRG